MNGRALLIGGLAGVASLAALCTTGIRAARAHASMTASTERYELARGLAARIAEVRSTGEAVPDNAPNRESMASRVSSVLSSCGIPSTALGELSPGTDTSIDVPGRQERALRRRVVVQLRDISLPKLGAFLDTWRAAEPEWIISRIDINPTAPKQEHQGGDLPLNVALAMEALFAETTGSNP